MRGTVPSPLGLIILLGATLLAGCITGDETTDEIGPLTSLQVYEYRYGGDDVAFPGKAYGWMALVTNPRDEPVAFVVEPMRPNETVYGPASNASWEVLEGPTPDLLPPGGSKLYLFQATFVEPVNATGFRVRVLEETPMDPAAPWNDLVTEEGVFLRELRTLDGLTVVMAGHHVRTATVGVWTNGTSFYTNIADLDADPRFPVGYDRSEFDDTPLPVYVFDGDRTEQPAGSKDTCHFTTITGYNALLKTQAEFSTNVRWLAPDEAYTLPGREEHDLYGHTLVFLNTIVQHDGGTTAADRGPNPQGECFDINNSSPVPIPPPLAVTTDSKS